jgi:2-polyprenyl-3-methyl-5-hydroxy-6-metoxy-1,4-benzoquinol methylase
VSPAVRKDYEAFEEALALFHEYSLQNDETLNQLQQHHLLPYARQEGFAVMDIGAGQGYLPSLMAPLTETMVLVEPNPRCVQSLQERFKKVYPNPWDRLIAANITHDYPAGFDLITMSHMLYHFKGLQDIREKICLAAALLKPGGTLAIILNTPSAPSAKVGVAYQQAMGRLDEALVNQEIHAHCLTKEFYTQLSDDIKSVEVYPIATPFSGVPDFETLVKLFRMSVLNPVSQAPFDEGSVDGFIRRYIQSVYPDLTYPATIDSHDKLILLKRTPSQILSQAC